MEAVPLKTLSGEITRKGKMRVCVSFTRHANLAKPTPSQLLSQNLKEQSTMTNGWLIAIVPKTYPLGDKNEKKEWSGPCSS